MWLKEPLVHFLILGALVFAVYSVIGPDAPGDDEIVVTRGQQDHLVAAFTRTWRRPPTQQEFNGIVDDWIREEIAYRESRELGLDTNDTIIRRRLRQKFEVLAEDIVSMEAPSTEELTAWLEANQSDYTSEPVYTLRQVYFNADQRGTATDQDAEAALLLLRTDSTLTNPEDLGDPITLRHRFVGERESEIGAIFGRQFVDGLADIEPGRWTGPILSGYGMHLVLIEDFTPGGPLSLEEAEAQVRRDWDNDRRKRAIDTLYERLRAEYDISIEPLDADDDS